MKLKDILHVIHFPQQFVISSDDGFAFDSRDFVPDDPTPYYDYYVLNLWYSELYKALFIDISKSPKE